MLNPTFMKWGLKQMKNMSTKMYALLLVVLGINTLRYGSYLLEDSTSLYNWILLCLNLLSLILGVVLRIKEIPVDSKSR